MKIFYCIVTHMDTDFPRYCIATHVAIGDAKYRNTRKFCGIQFCVDDNKSLSRFVASYHERIQMI